MCDAAQNESSSDLAVSGLIFMNLKQEPFHLKTDGLIRIYDYGLEDLMVGQLIFGIKIGGGVLKSVIIFKSG